MLTPIAVAQAYYTALGNKDIVSLAQYLHEQVRFSSPLTNIQGKEHLLEAVRKLLQSFTEFQLRTCFGSSTQAVVVYDLIFPGIGRVPTAAYLTVVDQLIVKVELFFDARPFVPA